MEKIRIQKLLADAGYCSRRKAEALIAAGKVKVNGHPVKLGDQATYKDLLTVNGERVAISRKKSYRYLMLYKPRGYAPTTSDELNRRCVMDLLTDVEERVYPIGRLDKDSEGLLLMTNHGDILNKIMRAGNYHEKEYEVEIDRPVTEKFIHKMQQGVWLSQLEVKTRPCKVKKIGEKKFSIILTQGLNRQIRRMCQECGCKVLRLKRVRIMNISLGNLKTGEYREVSDQEIEELYERIKESRS